MATQVREKADAVTTPAPHRWTRRQYDQMIEAGILGEDDRTEDFYQSKTTLHRGDALTPPKAANAIAIADLLP